MRLRIQHLCGAVFLGGVVGFPVVAASANLLGVGSTGLSVGVRVFVLFLGLLLLAVAPATSLSGRLKLMRQLIFVFWAVYGLRILYTIFILPENEYFSDVFLISFAFGACMIPCFAILKVLKFPPPQMLFLYIVGACLFVVVSGLISGTSEMASSGGELIDTGRLGLSGLNPIFFGHVGATVALLSYWTLRFPAMVGRRIFFVGIFVVGTIAMLSSGSRGPLVAWGISILFVEAIINMRIFCYLFFVFIITYIFFPIGGSSLDLALGTNVFGRIENGFGGGDVSTLSRGSLISASLSQFFDHPILGSGLFEHETGFYPHNIIVEGFMATGFLGGGIHFTILVLGVYFSYRLLLQRSQFGWIGLLLVQYSIAAQFSGSLFNSVSYWVLVAAVVAALRTDVNGESSLK